VTFFALLEDCYPGRLAVKDRDKTPRITGVKDCALILCGPAPASACCWLLFSALLLRARPRTSIAGIDRLLSEIRESIV
jgi:hypothetical protein